MSDLLLRNLRVIDPKSNSDRKADILISKGKIKQIADDIKVDNARILDLNGKIAFPGLIDMHVHLREPGREDKETIESGLKAAIAGGFTAVACMPNTSPVNDNAAVTEYILDRAKRLKMADVYPIGAISKDLAGQDLAEIADMLQAGAVAISDDGYPVSSSQLARRAMEYSRIFDIAIILHEEDLSLSANGVMHEGFISTRLGLKGIPAAAEEVMIARDMMLARFTGAKIHIAHLSTAYSVELIRKAKEQGIRVTAEVTPHHLRLTDEAVASYHPNTKMKPPLRSEEDRRALIQGVMDGTIDVIASDHAPHTIAEKEVEFDNAPFGVIGLETSLPVVLDTLYHQQGMPLIDIARALSTNAAEILCIKKGVIAEGSDADLTIIDLEAQTTIDPAKFYSKSKNTPFKGMTFKGAPVLTIKGGRILMENGILSR